MTAFLYIPSNSGLAKRVDFSNIAGLFSESEEPPPAHRGRRLLQIAAALLLVLIAIGDTVLITRPDALTSASVGTRHTLAGPGRLVTL